MDPSDSFDPLENFPILQELPFKSINKSQGNNHLSKEHSSNTKRGNILLENLKSSSNKTKEKGISQLSNHMLQRTQSLPPGNSMSCSIDEITQTSLAASEADAGETKNTSSNNLTGFQRFRQIVQSAQPPRRKPTVPEDFGDRNEIQSEDSFSGINTSSQRDTPLKRINSQPSASSTPTQQAVSLPGGFFRTVVQGASTTSFSFPQPPVKMSELKNQSSLRSQDLFGSSHQISPSLESAPNQMIFSLVDDITPETPIPPSRLKSREQSLQADTEPSEIYLAPRVRETIRETKESQLSFQLESPMIAHSSIERHENETTIQSVVQSRLSSEIMISDSDDYTLPSLCFSLDERMTSCASTLCGSYVISGFSTGNIRLYELLKSGNTDPEDRFGYILGHISSLGNTGLRVHVQCAGGLISTPFSTVSEGTAPPRDHVCSHIFVGARLGSTKFYVIDALSITRVKRKRGFLTMVDNQIQIYEKNDGRLRGFCSVVSISVTYVKCVYNQENENCRQNYDAIHDVGYQARYLLLCGAGYCTYNIWEVTLSAIPSCTCISDHTGHHDIVFSYTENWTVVHQGPVNAPSLWIGSIFSQPAAFPAWASGSGPSTFRIREELKFEYLTQGLNKDARIHQIFGMSMDELVEHNPSIHGRIIGSMESSYEDSHSNIPEEKLDIDRQNVENKIHSLRGVSSIHASSADGLIIFTGLDELIIYRMIRLDDLSIEIYERITFALNEFPTSRDLIQSTSTSRRKSVRHFRQIEEIECTTDGQYALIRCSDGAVLLYCLFNVFLCAIEPRSVEIKSQSPISPTLDPFPAGYLTLCYQIPEQFSLRMSLSYVENHRSLVDESALRRWKEKYPSLNHPMSVLVLTSWIPILATNGIGYPTNKEGVLKVNRLCSLSQSPSKFAAAFIPTLIAQIGIGLFQERSCPSNQSSCCLCGCLGISHWPELSGKKSDIPNTESSEPHLIKRITKRRNETKPSSEISVNSQNNGKRRKKSMFDDDIEIVETNRIEVEEVEFVPNPVEETPIDRKSKRPQQNRSEIESMQGEISTLQALVNEKDRECTTLMRKFDKRFEIEMKARRNWNAQMRELQEKLEIEQKKRMEMESRALEAERINSTLKEKLRPIMDLLQNDLGGDSSIKSNSGSDPIAAAPPPFLSFCVVCQANTADTIVLNCGHICLCNSHAISMRSEGYLKICPVCKQKCQGISRVHR